MRYYEFQLTETSIQNIIATIKKTTLKVVNVLISKLSHLKFGQTAEVKIINSKPHKITEANTGSQAKSGYMAEYATCHELTKLIHSQGLLVSYKQGDGKHEVGSDAVKLSEQFKNEYAENILAGVKNPEAAQNDIDLQIRAGEAMAKAMFDDAILPGEDLNICTFEVIHTGESMKFETKADAILRVAKLESKEVVDTLKASLKSYKGWSVNLSNTTIISIFDNLGIKIPEADSKYLKHGQQIRQTLFGIYKGAVNDYNGKNYKTVKSAAKKASTKAYGTEIWTPDMEMLYSEASLRDGLGVAKPTPQITKSALGSAWKAIAPKYLSRYSKVLQTGYNKNKTAVNLKLLEMLGIDGNDDFYLAVHNKGKDEFDVLTSRKSRAYADLLVKFNTGLNVKFSYPPESTATLRVDFLAPDGEVLRSTNISIGVSGSTGLAKNNWWFPFGDLR